MFSTHVKQVVNGMKNLEFPNEDSSECIVRISAAVNGTIGHDLLVTLWRWFIAT